MGASIGYERSALRNDNGDLPLQTATDRLAMTYADELNDQQTKLVTRGWKRWPACWVAWFKGWTRKLGTENVWPL